MKISELDAEVSQLTIETMDRIEKLADKLGESPAETFTWFIGKMLYSVASEGMTKGALVAHQVGFAMAEHYRAAEEGRTIKLGDKGGIQA